MRKRAFVIACCFISTLCFAQVEEPVKWSFSAKKINATAYEIHLTATIEAEWHIYSQNTPEGGPVPTSVSFAKNPLVTLNGNVKEIGKMEKRLEVLFGIEVRQYSDKVDFVQLVTVREGVKTSLAGKIEFMACNDQECLPPNKKPFSVSLN